MIFVNNFFSEIYFLQHSWVTHLIIFTKTFKKCFSWKYFSITKRITRKTVFLFPALALRTPTNNNVFQNSFLKKHYLKIFFLVFFYHPLCAHPLMNHTEPIEIFEGKQKSVTKIFSPNFNFTFVSSVLCTLTENFVVQKFFHGKFFQKQLLFLKLNFQIFWSFLCTPLIVYDKAFKKLINLKVILC